MQVMVDSPSLRAGVSPDELQLAGMVQGLLRSLARGEFTVGEVCIFGASLLKRIDEGDATILERLSAEAIAVTLDIVRGASRVRSYRLHRERDSWT